MCHSSRLLLLTAVVGMCGAGRVAPDEAEERAIAAVKKLGGKVEYHNSSVITVNLGGTAATDADLKVLAGLKHLVFLNLSATKVTDKGLRELARHKGLISLDLGAAKETAAGVTFTDGLDVTDAGLKHLAPLTSLQLLNLGGTQVTDKGLKELAPLKELVGLGLYSTKVTDAGLKELAALTKLSSLNLQKTQVTENGVSRLNAALPKCVITRE